MKNKRNFECSTRSDRLTSSKTKRSGGIGWSASTFPRRFTKISPAAVELHVSMELLSEGLETVTLTPDKESEVHHAPAPNTLRGGLFLADRMFFIKTCLADTNV